MAISRRDFIQRTAIGGAAVVGGLTLPAGCGNPVDAPPAVEAGVEDDPTDTKTYGTVRLNLDRVGDLAAVGGAVTVRLVPLVGVRERPFQLPKPAHLLVVHRGHIGVADEFIAVDSACPHAGCPLGYSPQLDKIACPCHSSQFRAVADPNDFNTCVGQVMHAPAKQGVTPYQAALDPEDLNTLVIDLKVINACGTLRLPPVVGGKVALPLDRFPALANVGGSVIGRPMGAPNPIAIVRTSAAADATAFSAVSAVCTHLGCTVDYAAPGAGSICGALPAGGFLCACHCSQFAADGTVINGPAAMPLTPFGVAFDGATVTITLS